MLDMLLLLFNISNSLHIIIPQVPQCGPCGIASSIKVNVVNTVNNVYDVYFSLQRRRVFAPLPGKSIVQL